MVEGRIFVSCRVEGCVLGTQVTRVAGCATFLNRGSLPKKSQKVLTFERCRVVWLRLIDLLVEWRKSMLDRRALWVVIIVFLYSPP